MERDLSNYSNPNRLQLQWKVRVSLWYYLGQPVFEMRFLPMHLRVSILKLFGARMGNGIRLRSKIVVHDPKNLVIGDHSWIGEEVWFINHEKITVGSDVCISQRSIICSGAHDYRSASLEHAHKPVKIKNGAWVCLDSKVLPGVTIGECSVVSAGEIVRKSIPDYSMLVGGKIRPIDPPK
jgi:putative colanic acid biosynthesis acetyltransferase WcaF